MCVSPVGEFIWCNYHPVERHSTSHFTQEILLPLFNLLSHRTATSMSFPHSGWSRKLDDSAQASIIVCVWHLKYLRVQDTHIYTHHIVHKSVTVCYLLTSNTSINILLACINAFNYIIYMSITFAKVLTTCVEHLCIERALNYILFELKWSVK